MILSPSQPPLTPEPPPPLPPPHFEKSGYAPEKAKSYCVLHVMVGFFSPFIHLFLSVPSCESGYLSFGGDVFGL